MAAVASCALAGVAQGQLTLAFDINGFNYHFKDSGGGTSFGGATHTGTVDWSFQFDDPGTTEVDETTVIADTRKGTGGQFGLLSPIALGPYTLTDITGSLLLSNGSVVSGGFEITLSNGDTYAAELSSGALSAVSSGFVLDGKTMEGEFSDASFGDIDVSEWFARQANPGELFGSIFKFRFAGGAEGNADMEAFVMVPLPTAAYAGLGMLAGVMGLSYVLRRR